MTDNQTGAPVPPPPNNSPELFDRPAAVASEPQGRPIQAILMLVVGLLLISGTVFAAYMGWVSIPYLFQPPTLEEIAENMKGIDSARLGIDMNLEIGQRDADVSSISVYELMGREPGDPEAEEMIGSMGMVTAFIPKELSISVSGSSDWDRSSDMLQGVSAFTGSFDMSGLSAEFDVEMRTIDKELYLRLNKIPPIIPSLSQVQGKWVKYTEDDEMVDEKQVLKYKSELEEDDIEDLQFDFLGELAVLMTEMISNGALTTEEKPEKAEDPLGRQAMRYVLTLERSKAIEAMRSAVNKREELLPNVEKFTILDDSSDTDTAFMYEDSFYEMISKNLELALYADRDGGMPLALSYKVVIAFDEKEMPDLSDIQLSVSQVLTFDRINLPIDVEAPAEFLTKEEVEALTSSISDDDQMMRDQIDMISDIRDALEAYHKVNGAYPVTLEMLLGTEVVPSYVTDDSFAKVVVAIPNDLYTDQPLQYAPVEDGGYTLAYNLTIPETTTYIFRNKFISGLNTATPDTKSLEGDPVSDEDDDSRFSATDTDKDGLSDFDEMFKHGTDPNMADTDGDGYDDGAEVEGGYDPLTNAQTGVKVE